MARARLPRIPSWRTSRAFHEPMGWPTTTNEVTVIQRRVGDGALPDQAPGCESRIG
ncbi:MAG: hypothetical protein FJW09_00235 [Actinobacteria bacterium]|nr:hypothetical protein [Actinomycetota bacterium]